MKNYQDSDYARNKFRKGIVYKFQGQTVEVTMADCLAENSDKTREDFLVLKALSDGIYLDQVRAENTQTKNDISLSDLKELADPAADLDNERIAEARRRRCSSAAIAHVLESDLLTEKQRRRFILYIHHGLSTRQIVNQEGAEQRAIVKSLHAAFRKLKYLFD